MIVIKNDAEIECMRKAGQVTGEILRDLPKVITPGMSTKELDDWIYDYIIGNDMKPAFKGYGGFPGTACISVNEEVIHGIPSKKKILNEGDIVSVDLGTIYKDYYSDAARTYPVGEISKDKQKLIQVAKESFLAGIQFAKVGCRLGDVSHAIQECIEAAGFSVIRDYVGHGVGRDLHEDPQVPNYGRAGRGPRLCKGMTLAIEPMVSAGGFKIKVLENDWTVVPIDGSMTAHYENTVLITEGEPELLTCLD